MRLCVIQMDMRLGESAYNFAHAEALLRRAAAEGADTALLPETWNTGFFPADHLPERSDRGGEAVKALCAPLARELNMNIVAGSVSDRRGGRVYNTAYVFDRQGACLAAYDKTHLFTPMGEHEHYAAGDHLTTFSLDGHKCGLLICYDLRFPELFRTLALQGVELLLLPAQWPAARRDHWETLTAARAIENQFFLAACNSCGTAGETVFGGASRILGPRGELLAAAGAGEEIVTAAQRSLAGGAQRFSIVTSGRKLTREEVTALCETYRALKRACPQLRLCASHGLLDEQEFAMLKEAGVERYHNNLETSRGFFGKICTTHSYDDKLETIRRAKNAGLAVCSGGIIGMGEGMAERIDLAIELRGLEVRSVPLNILNPIKGTPLGGMPALPQEELRRSAAIFRFLLPDAAIRLAGGRNRLRAGGREMLEAGVNAAITGDMLTTSGAAFQSDREMIAACGFRAGLL